MSKHHIGIHVLTAYPPSNPNRDENGQPKTAIVNGVTRQRISSQCIKRAWRLSEMMQSLGDSYSLRTRAIGELAIKEMPSNISPQMKERYAIAMVYGYGKRHKKEPLSTAEVVVLGPEEVDFIKRVAQSLEQVNVDDAELENVLSAVSKVAAKVNDQLTIKEDQKDGDIKKLREGIQKATTSIDVSLFGRMRASNTGSVRISVCKAVEC